MLKEQYTLQEHFEKTGIELEFLISSKELEQKDIDMLGKAIFILSEVISLIDKGTS